MAGDIWRLDRFEGALAQMRLAADSHRFVVCGPDRRAGELQPPLLRPMALILRHDIACA
nr:hypothetical protein [Paracoccus saliphilus]